MPAEMPAGVKARSTTVDIAPFSAATAGDQIAGPTVAQICETHSAYVVLASDRAYKIKKHVNLGFLDFRTLAARKAACQHELVLNRRLAPDVYEGMAAIEDSHGKVIDYVLIMRRMPEAARLSRLAQHGDDCGDDVRAIAKLLARFHSSARRDPQMTAQAGAAGLRRRWLTNLGETEAFRGSLIPESVRAHIGDLALRYIAGRRPLFDRRAANGLFVDGHGDLTAEDIFCFPDHPRVLDCIDFDDTLRSVDVLDDAAFLAMDLERLGRPELAEQLLAHYSEFSGVPSVPSLQHHYIAYRAFVRAKVACIRLTQTGASGDAAVAEYTQLAIRHLEAADVKLVLVGGAPGTGKTTIADRLADALGATLLSTDAIRAQLPADARNDYGTSGKRAVYRELLTRARHAVEFGESVVADATWGLREYRVLAGLVARETHTTLLEVECTAPIDIAADRAQQRLASGLSASQAGAALARTLARQRDPWPSATAVDTAGSADDAIVGLAATLGIDPCCAEAPR